VSITELIGIAIGCTLIALGVTSIGTWGIRRGKAEWLLLLFGIWCVLYGVRLVAEQPVVRASLGGSTRGWAYVIAFITYGINVPTGLFFEALVGQGWMQSVRRMWQVQAVYAVVAIVLGLVVRNPTAAMPLNNPIVMIGLVIQAFNVLWYRGRLGPLFTTPIIAVGGVALLFAVIHENLGRPLVPQLNLESLGVLIFVLALGYGVIGSVVRGEAELLAVQRELEAARLIQRSLLPREAPRTRGLDAAVRFVPMSAVAGDLYDFVELGPSKIGILVADVSGHGIPAALVASMVKLAFSAQADHADDPARVLSAINRALCHQLDHGFVTAIYVVVDVEDSMIRVANAGHPPLFIGSSSRGVVDVHEHGLMLGFMPDASYKNVEIELQDGDRILLYTDGVIEAQNAAGEFFDGERVGRWLTSDHAGNDVVRLGDVALADLNRWRGHLPFEDDVTFVIAHFTASP
jgi:phosphoserine phosphatase RsbU/P